MCDSFYIKHLCNLKVCIAVVSLEKVVNLFTIIVIIIVTHHHRRHHCRPLSLLSLSFFIVFVNDFSFIIYI